MLKAEVEDEVVPRPVAVRSDRGTRGLVLVHRLVAGCQRLAVRRRHGLAQLTAYSQTTERLTGGADLLTPSIPVLRPLGVRLHGERGEESIAEETETAERPEGGTRSYSPPSQGSAVLVTPVFL